MAGKTFFFAGGGTGGHIYPALAVAEKLRVLDSGAGIRFFVSSRDIDKHVLSKTGFEYTVLPATGLSMRPDKLLRFIKLYIKSRKTAAEVIAASPNPVVIGVGGYVAAPVCRAARRLRIPLVLINVDFVPGRANRIISKWADKIFIQFEETAEYFGRHKKKTSVTGCPLRSGFENPEPGRAIESLGLDKTKKVLLITGASSGSQNINRTVCSLLDKMADFTDSWQIVHLAGRANITEVQAGYTGAKISHKVMDYHDDMADLLACADLVIGRSGAVSAAEYAACGTPVICLPYPYHSDMHQYLNAGKLVDAGMAVIVDDIGDDKDRREWLWEELEPLLKDDKTRLRMKESAKTFGKNNASDKIARELLNLR